MSARQAPTALRPQGNGRLVVDVTDFFHATSGGVRTYLEAKAAFLARLPGWRHAVVVPGPSDGLEERNGTLWISVRSPEVPGARPYRLMVRPGHLFRLLVDLKPDLIEVGSPYLPAWLAPRLRRALGAPVVGFYHSDLPRSYVRPVGQRLGLAGAWLEPLAWAYVRHAYWGTDQVLAPSRDAAEALRQHGITRVAVQPLGVDLERFHPARRDPSRRADILAQAGLDPDRSLLLLSVGRLSVEKRPQLLVQAVEAAAGRGAPIHLHLAGAGPAASALRRLADGNPSVLSLAGPVERGDLPALYASADAFATASLHETFGLAALEAQASGLPVVAVPAGALPEVLDPSSRFLAPGHRVEDLSREIERLVEAARGGRLETLRRSARRHAEVTGGWPQVLTQLLTTYEGLLRRRETRFGFDPMSHAIEPGSERSATPQAWPARTPPGSSRTGSSSATS